MWKQIVARFRRMPRKNTLAQVEVSMVFDWQKTRNVASVKWTMLNQSSGLSTDSKKIALAAFLYARTIVNHSETRHALVERTGPGATQLMNGARFFLMDDWSLFAGGHRFSIYPWDILEPESISESARTYKASLLEIDGTFGGHLKMAFGYEQVLAPAAPLILIASLANDLSAPTREVLGKAVLLVNGFYGQLDLDKDSLLYGSDALATTEIVRLLKGSAGTTNSSN